MVYVNGTHFWELRKEGAQGRHNVEAKEVVSGNRSVPITITSVVAPLPSSPLASIATPKAEGLV